MPQQLHKNKNCIKFQLKNSIRQTINITPTELLIKKKTQMAS